MSQANEAISLIKDVMINEGAGNAETLALIMKQLKEEYVNQHHDRSITCIAGRGWRTWVGNPRKQILRRTREDLIDYLYDYYKQIETGEQLRTLTLDQLFEMYKTYRTDTLNRSVKTVENEDSSYRRFIINGFGKTKVIDITEDMLRDHIQETLRQASPTPMRLKRFIWLLDNVFSYAIRKHIIGLNPAADLDAKDYVKDCKPVKHHSTEKILSSDEISELKKYEWQHKTSPCSLAILLSIETGMRIGEIPPLRWSDIENGQINIHRQQLVLKEKGNWSFYEVGYTKNERGNPKGGRWFPITQAIQKILDECSSYQASLRLKKPSEFIFCDENGSWLLNTTIQQYLKRHCRKLGLDVTNNHALRMSLNSNVLIPAGFSDQQRSYLLGHSVRTNLMNYSYTRRETVQNACETLERFAGTAS